MTNTYVLELTVAAEAAHSTSSATEPPRPPKTIVGYCWPWTARAGEQIEFKVSTLAPGEYRAELVRIICGDNQSAADRYKEIAVPASFAGNYAGRHQPTYPGSFVQIPAAAPLDGLGSFTVQTLLFPTRLAATACEQHLVSRWDTQRRVGWSLLIDGQDRLVFRMGGNSGVRDTIVDRPLTERRWYLAVASVDAARRHVSVTLECHDTAPANLIAEPRSQIESDYPFDFTITQTGPLLFAACARGMHCFNGRLDRVRISRAAIDLSAARSLCAPEPPAADTSVIGFWDFAADIDRIEVRDLSGNGLHGATINAPMRAVAGVDWDGSTEDWRHAPQHYSAIHFHDDDLYDAQWQTDFHFRVPEDLPSGVYAARLLHGESEDYVPFFVAPPKGETRARVALLLPTATYTAYTNVTSILIGRAKVLREKPDGELCIEHEGLIDTTVCRDAAHVDFLLEHAHELGAGVYGSHTDGTFRTSASQKHPNLSTKPKGMNWTLVADTYLIEWLENRKIPYDILTDDLLEREGLDLLKEYRVVLTGNHPEYYSKKMLDAVSDYHELGGRWMYLGGNGFCWVASFHSQLSGLMEVRKSPAVPASERRHAFDGANGGLWRDNGRPPQRLVGVGTSGVTLNSACAYKRLPDSYHPRASFIFEGVESELIGNFGVMGGGAAGQEVDRMSPELGTPRHALHLARADQLYPTHPIDGEPAPFADIVFFEGPRGGAVFSVGSISWVGALGHNAHDNNVSRITENVLRRFMDEKPFEPAIPTR